MSAQAFVGALPKKSRLPKRSILCPKSLAGKWAQGSLELALYLNSLLQKTSTFCAKIETSVTFCGMVWLRATVLGRLGIRLPNHGGGGLACRWSAFTVGG